MEATDFEKNLQAAGRLRVIRPPEGLRPEGDVRKTLESSLEWCRQNPDRGYRAFLTSPEGGDPEEAHTWGIRQALRHRGPAKSLGGKAEEALKWHFFLHLWREMEERKREADLLLRDLKAQKSPLQDMFGGEGEPGTGLLDDLGGFRDEPAERESRVVQVLEAWLGLFGESFPEAGVLVTFDPAILDALIAVMDRVSPAETAQENAPVRFGWTLSVRETGSDADPTLVEGDLEVLQDLKTLIGDRTLPPKEKAEKLRALAEGGPGAPGKDIETLIIVIDALGERGLAPLTGRTILCVNSS